MRRTLNSFKSKAMFTFVGGLLVVNPAFAQDVARRLHRPRSPAVLLRPPWMPST